MKKYEKLIKNLNKYTYYTAKLLNHNTIKYKNIPFYKQYFYFRNEQLNINKNKLIIIKHNKIDYTTINNYINSIHNIIQKQYTTIPTIHINTIQYYINWYNTYIETTTTYQQLQQQQ